MNNVSLIGRLTRDPEIYVSNKGKDELTVARYTMAIDRWNSEDADFISCVAFGKCGEFAEKYLVKGMKIGVTGRLQSGSYVDKDDITRYTTDVVVDSHYFCESKKEEKSDEETKKSSKKGSGRSRR